MADDIAHTLGAFPIHFRILRQDRPSTSLRSIRFEAVNICSNISMTRSRSYIDGLLIYAFFFKGIHFLAVMYDVYSGPTFTFQLFLDMNHVEKVRLFHFDDHIDITILFCLPLAKEPKMPIAVTPYASAYSPF